MKVLFICRSNAGRSQAAAAYFEKFTKRNTATSAGAITKVEGQLGKSPGDLTITTLKNEGIDISKRKRKQVTQKMLKEAGKIVVIMSKAERKRFLPKYFNLFSDKIIFWNIKDLRTVKTIPPVLRRNSRIKRLVLDLVKKLG